MPRRGKIEDKPRWYRRREPDDPIRYLDAGMRELLRQLDNIPYERVALTPSDDD